MFVTGKSIVAMPIVYHLFIQVYITLPLLSTPHKTLSM